MGAAALAIWPNSTQAQARGRVLVAAAADLQGVLPGIIGAFQAAGGGEVSVAFGSTGNLARQIRQGAPFELFLAADESYVQHLARDRIIPTSGKPYARGRLALAVNSFGPSAKAPDLTAVASAVRRGEALRFAIANPDHAPYGQRAVEALRSQGVYDVMQPRLIFGETVAQALQYVATGAAAAGLVGSSLAKTAGLGDRIAITDIPETWHTPLIQRLALTAKASAAAAAFAMYITSEPARGLFQHYGFEPAV